MANDALVPVAQAHYERNKDLVAHVLASNSTADLPDSSLPVFYATVDMARNSELFKELKFSNAPNLFLAPPRLSTSTLKTADFVRTLPQKYRFNLQASMSANDFNSFTNKLASCHVQLDAVKPGLVELLTTLVVLSLIAGAGFKYGQSTSVQKRCAQKARMEGVASVADVLWLCFVCS